MTLTQFKKIVSLFLTVSIVFCFAGCNSESTNIKGEVSSVSYSSSVVNDDNLHKYDYKNLEESDELDTEPKESYYKSSFDEKTALVFDDISKAISNSVKTVNITRNLSEDQLKQIMYIMLIDMPEYFHLLPKYSYTTSTNNFVSQVSFNYAMSKKDYDESYKTLSEYAKNSFNSMSDKVLQYDTELNIITKISQLFSYSSFSFDSPTQKKTILSDSELDGYSGNCASTIIGLYNKKTINCCSVAKMFTFLARTAGLPASCVIGEMTDSSLKNIYDGDYNEFKIPKDSESISKNKDSVEIELSPDNFYTWNIVEINNKWYNVDLYYQQMQNIYLLSKEYITDVSNIYNVVNVPDNVMAESRLSYYTEDVLGILPSCSNQTFQYCYRNGLYFPSYNSSQITVAINNLLSALLSKTAKGTYIQFEDEQTYNLFIDTIDNQIKQFNSENKQAIKKYDIFKAPNTLTVFISNMTY